MTEKRTICRTPAIGKQPTFISSWKYEIVRAAILKVVPAHEPGVPTKDLAALIRPLLGGEVIERLGSVSWHTTTVKLNMEVEGELRRTDGLKPQHLYRTKLDA